MSSGVPPNVPDRGSLQAFLDRWTHASASLEEERRLFLQCLDDLSAARMSRDLLELWRPRSESVPTSGLVEQQRLFQALLGRHLAEPEDR